MKVLLSVDHKTIHAGTDAGIRNVLTTLVPLVTVAVVVLSAIGVEARSLLNSFNNIPDNRASFIQRRRD
jgi:hypothetical protein